ncbi:MAG TPA: energy-coupled thiamine transporter ThiT [Lactobacillaceae bacterium]|jgi:thiamine transporter
MKQTKFNAAFIAEVAIFTALAAVLNWVSVWNMPAGGSVTLVALPIVFLALRRGLVAGLIAGLLMGIISFVQAPYFMNAVQFAFDYLLAFTGLGLAGLTAASLQYALRRDNRSAAVWAGVIGAVIGNFARFVFHFIAGWAFYGDSAPKGQPAWLYSLIYNGSYMLPNLVITAVVIAILVYSQPKLFKA